MKDSVKIELINHMIKCILQNDILEFDDLAYECFIDNRYTDSVQDAEDFVKRNNLTNYEILECVIKENIEYGVDCIEEIFIENTYKLRYDFIVRVYAKIKAEEILMFNVNIYSTQQELLNTLYSLL